MIEFTRGLQKRKNFTLVLILYTKKSYQTDLTQRLSSVGQASYGARNKLAKIKDGSLHHVAM